MGLILGLVFVGLCLFYYLEQRRRMRMAEKRERFMEKQADLVEEVRQSATVDASTSLSKVVSAQFKFMQDSKAVEGIFRDVVASEMSEQSKARRLADVVLSGPGQPIVVKRLCMFLQVLNEEVLLAQFGLEDIENLFVEAIQLYPNDVGLRMEYVYFLYNVLDREEEALAHFRDLKAQVQEQFDEFERAIKE